MHLVELFCSLHFPNLQSQPVSNKNKKTDYRPLYTHFLYYFAINNFLHANKHKNLILTCMAFVDPWNKLVKQKKCLYRFLYVPIIFHFPLYIVCAIVTSNAVKSSQNTVLSYHQPAVSDQLLNLQIQKSWLHVIQMVCAMRSCQLTFRQLPPCRFE